MGKILILSIIAIGTLCLCSNVYAGGGPAHYSIDPVYDTVNGNWGTPTLTQGQAYTGTLGGDGASQWFLWYGDAPNSSATLLLYVDWAHTGNPNWGTSTLLPTWSAIVPAAWYNSGLDAAYNGNLSFTGQGGASGTTGALAVLLPGSWSNPQSIAAATAWNSADSDPEDGARATYTVNHVTTAIPEPVSILLLSGGLLGIAAFARRKII